MSYAVLKGSSYTLAFTPSMVLHNGTTQTTEMVVNPESEYLKELPNHLRSYEDVVNYNELLFLIELGYFDGSLLSIPENDNGIIVKDIDNLQGKTIQIKQDEGYFAYVHTADSDDIAIGDA